MKTISANAKVHKYISIEGSLTNICIDITLPKYILEEVANEYNKEYEHYELVDRSYRGSFKVQKKLTINEIDGKSVKFNIDKFMSSDSLSVNCIVSCIIDLTNIKFIDLSSEDKKITKVTWNDIKINEVLKIDKVS